MDNSSMVDATQRLRAGGQREWEYAIELRRSAIEDRWIDVTIHGVAKDEVSRYLNGAWLGEENTELEVARLTAWRRGYAPP